MDCKYCGTPGCDDEELFPHNSLWDWKEEISKVAPQLVDRIEVLPLYKGCSDCGKNTCQLGILVKPEGLTIEAMNHRVAWDTDKWLNTWGNWVNSDFFNEKIDLGSNSGLSFELGNKLAYINVFQSPVGPLAEFWFEFFTEDDQVSQSFTNTALWDFANNPVARTIMTTTFKVHLAFVFENVQKLLDLTPILASITPMYSFLDATASGDQERMEALARYANKGSIERVAQIVVPRLRDGSLAPSNHYVEIDHPELKAAAAAALMRSQIHVSQPPVKARRR